MFTSFFSFSKDIKLTIFYLTCFLNERIFSFLLKFCNLVTNTVAINFKFTIVLNYSCPILLQKKKEEKYSL